MYIHTYIHTSIHPSIHPSHTVPYRTVPLHYIIVHCIAYIHISIYYMYILFTYYIYIHTYTYCIFAPGPANTPPPHPRRGLLGTMRRNAFNRNDLERDKTHSSSGFSSSCMITCCYASALHLYLSTHLLLC